MSLELGFICAEDTLGYINEQEAKGIHSATRIPALTAVAKELDVSGILESP
ncbi:uncharacterized protein PHALS_04474 [Plasmopara halstedii]|uniref:Uncharacterized protein n=1 Tax=Plasmopara halstedii TaxID=4781 RepID=A0A0P1A8U4_PLAHL|nr:uncharacterized protein PHALS_04474 [Plasmopara halstedii]CEG37008.1 hypothetical protein PHALS_04474 [Plasmopara halstedii]|eukprot:XP_024573377.1 hypothetical protein PHALS_04474 [Plasmopara halstedii]